MARFGYGGQRAARHARPAHALVHPVHPYGLVGFPAGYVILHPYGPYARGYLAPMPPGPYSYHGYSAYAFQLYGFPPGVVSPPATGSPIQPHTPADVTPAPESEPEPIPPPLPDAS
jgi:hypothetical protein